jgi:VanZ family protein
LDQLNQPQPFNTKLSDFATMRDVGGNMRYDRSARQDGVVKQLLDQSNHVSRYQLMALLVVVIVRGEFRQIYFS